MALYIGTSHPAYVRHAVAELRRLDPDLDQVEVLADGLFRFATSLERAGWTAALERAEPVFLRHQHPVSREVPLGGDAADLPRLAAVAAALLAEQPAGQQVAVQVRRAGAETDQTRFAVKEALDAVIAAHGSAPAVRDPDAILSVTMVGATAHAGLSFPAENLSPWPGGELRFRRADVVSRAAFKLLEAWERFGLNPPPGGSALDLGAAPGGWTQVLLEQGLQVTAIDPAPLDPQVAGRPGLTYRRLDAKELTPGPRPAYDLLTCDMNWDPLATARLVARLAPCLRPGGQGVLTVKLLGSVPPARLLKQVTGLLTRGGWQVVRFKQLYHNRDEVTALLRPQP